MEGWNAQMMLDLYIYDYLIKNNLHTVAEIFAAEANLAPKPVALDSPEGFLSEWWSVFWSIYSSRIPVNIETTEGSSSKSGGDAPLIVVHPTRVVPSRDINFVPNVTCTSNMPHTVDPTVMPNPNIEKLQCPVSATMRRPDSNLNGVIPIRISDPSVLQGEKLKNLINAMQNQERLRLPSDQLSHMLPSSSNRSHPPEKIYKKHPLRIVEDDSSRTSLRIEEPIARAPGQDNLSHSIENLDSNSQLLDADQLACLLSSSDNCSNPQKNLYKTSRLSTTRD